MTVVVINSTTKPYPPAVPISFLGEDLHRLRGLNISRAKIFDHAQFGSSHAHFCTIEAIVTMQHEKTNIKSRKIDLAATYSLIIRPI